MPNHLLTLILSMAMVCCTTAKNFYGRGIYGRVMLDPRHPNMDGDTQGYAGWNTVDKVSSVL
jgi:hypothetical protein